MSKIRLMHGFILVAALSCGTGGCGFVQGGSIVRLWSQTPDILPFVDRFNAGARRFKIEAVYVASPAEELLPAQTVPDLILAKRLSAPRCAAALENLAPLLHGNGIDEKLFYRELLKRHKYQNTTAALPFSFELPVIVFRKGTFPKGSPTRLTLDELKSAGAAFVKTVKGKPVAIGFSPLLNQDFLFNVATLFEVDFHAEPGRILSWQEGPLEEWVRSVSDWCGAGIGGYAAESEFVRKYLYGSPPQLLQTKIPQSNKADDYRLSFYCASAHDFFAIGPEKREKLEMAWPSRNGRIPVTDGILFFGVPRGAHNRSGAYEFLKWVFSPETQEAVLKENAVKNPRSLGLAGGFSSLISINERVLPAQIPMLKGRIPSEGELLFPGPLPETWDKLKNESVLPWLFGRLSRSGEKTSLKDMIK